MDSIFATPDFNHEVDDADGVDDVVALLRLLTESASVEPEQKEAAQAALAQKTARVAALERDLARQRVRLDDLERAAVEGPELEDGVAGVVGPYNLPSYDLEIIGEDRRMRLIPKVDGELGAAIERGLIPGPSAYDLTVTAYDGRNHPIKATLKPVRTH